MTTEPGEMLCPTCKVPLVMSERQSIEIDYCPKCRGVWLDRGELDKIIEKSGSQEPQAAAQRPEHRDEGYRGGHHGYRRKSWLSDIFD